jgi:SAM-dependent methyltransferase
MTEARNWTEHSGTIVESKNGSEIIDCFRCGFKHLIPIPSMEELNQIYRSEYYTTEKPDYIDRNLEDQEWWRIVYDERLKLFESLLPEDRREILEIGSGPGFFLQRAMNRGWKGLGIEPSTRAAEYSKALGVESRNEFLTDKLSREIGNFDVVYMNEVLEHIPDPIRMMATAVRLLNPEGLLCVIVPNDYNPIQKALHSTFDFPSWWVAIPHHINYFDLSSITGLVRKAGLTLVDTEATFPIDLFLLMGDNYIGNDELGRKCHGKRMRLEVNLKKAGLSGLKRTLYRSFAEVGLGREIQVIARKDKCEKP